MKWSEQQRQNAADFSRRLQAAGFDFFTGVPCSLVGSLIEELSRGKTPLYIPAVREDAAIAMAGGAYLAGRRAGVLMQNSGIGNSLNVLTSLNLIYRIPVLCLVTYRGLGADAPEHLVMGKSCRKILAEIGVPSLVPEAAGLGAALGTARRHLEGKRTPFALMIRRGIFGR